MKKKRLLHQILLFLLIVTACTSCVPKIKPTPYQLALNGYYKALSTAASDPSGKAVELEKVEKDVTTLLEANARDPEMRMLHASIRLSQYQENKTEDRAKDAIRDVRLAVDAANVQTGTAEWIVPRAYIILGDLMTLTANSGMSSFSISDENSKKQGYILAGWYDVAAAFYLKGFRIAKERQVALDANSPPALITQRENAKLGLFNAFAVQAKIWQKFNKQDRVKEKLLDMEGVLSEKDEVINKVSALLPAQAIDIVDPTFITQLSDLNSSLGNLEPNVFNQRSWVSLRLAIIKNFQQSPILPLSNNEVNGFANDIFRSDQ